MRKKILNSVLFLCFLGGVIFSSASVHAAVWYVDADAPGGDGTSWGTAFDNIQDAINACSSTWMICMGPTDQIWVKAGFYSLSNQINVNKYVAIYGGFNGTETSSSQRDWENNITLVNGNDSVRCFNITAHAIIDGFNIRRGRASSANGGGIYIDSSPVYCSMLDFYHVAKIRNCTINQNTAELDGGGIYDLESDPVITNCSFIENSATCGGGIKNWQSSPVIEKCRFEANRSTGQGSWGGGAICSDYLCYGTITNCIFYLNESNSRGGAIAYHMAYPYITNCTFSENEAVHSGGAIYANTGGPRVKNCIFWDDAPDEILFEFTSSTWPYVNYSDIMGGYSGTDNIDDDPEFVTPPIDLHLSFDSPCIDSGTNTGAPSDDMDGVSRPQDGDGDATAISDMGAYEFTVLPVYKGDFDGDGDVDGSDLADFAKGTATISLKEFAIDFGRT
jgi:predicted outer membrane repeat protein